MADESIKEKVISFTESSLFQFAVKVMNLGKGLILAAVFFGGWFVKIEMNQSTRDKITEQHTIRINKLEQSQHNIQLLIATDVSEMRTMIKEMSADIKEMKNDK